MLIADGYPVSVACRAVNLPRSSFYYQPTDKDEAKIRAAIQEIAARYPTYGSRRIAAQLRRGPYHFQINRKRVRRLMRELGLVVKPKRKKVATTDSRHPQRHYPNLVEGLEINHPDQVWVADITYIRLGEGFVYLAVVMDVFTRGIRGWALSRFLDHGLAQEALEIALTKGTPNIHHSDQGVQYTADEYVELLEKHDVKISMSQKGRPDQNGYAERVIRTIKEEEVELSEYEDFRDAKARIGEFIEEVYQKKRIHSALGYLTPAEFEEKWHRERETAASLSKNGSKTVQLLGSTTVDPHHPVHGEGRDGDGPQRGRDDGQKPLHGLVDSGDAGEVLLGNEEGGGGGHGGPVKRISHRAQGHHEVDVPDPDPIGPEQKR